MLTRGGKKWLQKRSPIRRGRRAAVLLTLLEPQSHFGDRPLKLQVVCPQNGTAVRPQRAKGLGDILCYVRGGISFFPRNFACLYLLPTACMVSGHLPLFTSLLQQYCSSNYNL